MMTNKISTRLVPTLKLLLRRQQQPMGRHYFNSTESQQSGFIYVLVGFVDERTIFMRNELLGPDQEFPLPGAVSIQQQPMLLGHEHEKSDIAATRSEEAIEGVLKKLDMSEFAHRIAQLLNVQDTQSNDKYEPSTHALQERADQVWQNKVRLCVTSSHLLAAEVAELFELEQPQSPILAPPVTLIGVQAHKREALEECPNEEDARTPEERAKDERVEQAYAFVRVADAICDFLSRAGFWADFVDPRNGCPYRAKKLRMPHHRNAALARAYGMRSQALDRDPARQFVGTLFDSYGKFFEDVEWESERLIGAIFTNAPVEAEAIKQLLGWAQEAKMELEAADEGEEENGNTVLQ